MRSTATRKTTPLRVAMRPVLRTPSTSMCRSASHQLITMIPIAVCHPRLSLVLNKSKEMSPPASLTSSNTRMRRNATKKNKNKRNLNVWWKWSTWKHSSPTHSGTSFASSSKKTRRKSMKPTVSSYWIGWPLIMSLTPLLKTHQSAVKKWKTNSLKSSTTTWRKPFTSVWELHSLKIETKSSRARWNVAYWTCSRNCSQVSLSRLLSGATGPLMRKPTQRQRQSPVKFPSRISARSNRQAPSARTRNVWGTHRSLNDT